MIKSEFGVVTVKGSAPTILAELSVAIESINRNLSKDFGAEATEEMLKMAFEDGMKSESCKSDPIELLLKLLLGGKSE